MNKIKKFVFVLLIVFTMSGCIQKNRDYYDHVANTIISFYRTSTYDEKSIHKDDREIIKKYLSTLTHQDQIVDIGDYVDMTLPSNESNSSELTSENGTCYMPFSTLKSKFDAFHQTDPTSVIGAYYTVTCNGYYAVLKEDDFYPDYADTITNPVYNYVLLKILKTDEGYNYIYSSTYNGSGLSLELKIQNGRIVTIDTTDVDPYNYIEEDA